MKKIINLTLIFFILIFTTSPVHAIVARVEALNDYNTKENTEYLSFKLLETISVDEKITLNANTIFKTETYKIKNPKRLKRNASFVLKIQSYTDDQTTTNTNTLYAKYTTKPNKAAIAKDAALTAGNIVVKGFSMGYKTAEGIIQNKEGRRLKSGAVAAYNASPVSYVSKGTDISIKNGDTFLLNFNYIEPNNHNLIDKFIYSVDEDNEEN